MSFWAGNRQPDLATLNIAKLLLHMHFLSAIYSLLRPKSLCLRILANRGILTHISVFM